MTELLSGAMRVRVKKLRERDVQESCVGTARRAGWWARKFSSPSQRSVPDYLFAKKRFDLKVKFAVEFKKPGETATKAQKEEHAAMRAEGWDVYVCDHPDKFRPILEEQERKFLQEMLDT